MYKWFLLTLAFTCSIVNAQQIQPKSLDARTYLIDATIDTPLFGADVGEYIQNRIDSTGVSSSQFDAATLAQHNAGYTFVNAALSSDSYQTLINTNKKVYFPAGTYTWSTIALVDSVEIFGDGEETVFEITGTDTAFKFISDTTGGYISALSDTFAIGSIIIELSDGSGLSVGDDIFIWDTTQAYGMNHVYYNGIDNKAKNEVNTIIKKAGNDSIYLKHATNDVYYPTAKIYSIDALNDVYIHDLKIKGNYTGSAGTRSTGLFIKNFSNNLRLKNIYADSLGQLLGTNFTYNTFLSGGKFNGVGYIIFSNADKRCYIENCDAYDLKDNGVNYSYTSDNSAAYNCKIYTRYNATTSSGFVAQYSTNVKFDHCYTDGYRYSILYDHWSDYGTVTNNTVRYTKSGGSIHFADSDYGVIQNNTITDYQATLGAITLEMSGHTKVIGNTIFNSYPPAAGNRSGIALNGGTGLTTSSGTIPNDDINMSEIIVKDNHITGMSFNGITTQIVSASGSGTRDLIIESNVIDSCGRGITIQDGNYNTKLRRNLLQLSPSLSPSSWIAPEDSTLVGDYTYVSDALDLSGVGDTLFVFLADRDYFFLGCDFIFTEASSADAAINIEIGKITAGTPDYDYFLDKATSVSASLWDKQSFSLSTEVIGRWLYFDEGLYIANPGGKVGTGEVKLIIKFAEF